MLLWLEIENYIIIDKIRIDFSKGMNVISGETGSGKSLILSAMDFALAGKRPINPIGPFANTCKVSLKIEHQGQDLLFQREIFSKTSSSMAINGNRVSLKKVRDLKSQILSLYHQNTHSLMSSSRSAMDSLDAYINLDLNNYTALYNEYRNIQSQLKGHIESYQNQDQIDFKLKQLAELKTLDPTKEDYNGLIDQIKADHSLEVQSKALSKAYKSLNSIQTTSLLLELKSHLDAYHDDSMTSAINSIVLDFDDLSQLIKTSYRELNLDLTNRQAIDKRLEDYHIHIKRYGSLSNLCFYYDELLSLESKVANYQDKLTRLETQCLRLEDQVTSMAQQISIQRSQAIKPFCESVKNYLSYMKLDKIEFNIKHDTSTCHSRGMDHLLFQVNLNQQDEEVDLVTTASGGEISRFTLALLLTLAQKHQEHIYIFDEIDAGVSGLVSHSMGQLIQSLSQDHQVLIITHQAAMASYATQHMTIRKIRSSDQTRSHIQTLNNEERILELALMMSGQESRESMALAQQLLKKGGDYHGSPISY